VGWELVFDLRYLFMELVGGGLPFPSEPNAHFVVE